MKKEGSGGSSGTPPGSIVTPPGSIFRNPLGCPGGSSRKIRIVILSGSEVWETVGPLPLVPTDEAGILEECQPALVGLRRS